jgi:hypothetical protein
MSTTFTAAGPEDLLAAVPIVLGFEPHASLVMLTFAGPHPFHARVDLPPRGDPAALDETAGLMLTPVLDNDVGIVAFVLYTADRLLARRLGRRLVRRFLGADVPVLDCLRADQGRWWSALGDDPRVPAGGVPYDSGTHPFRAQAVFDGLVTLGSREELAASLASDPAGVAAVERVLPRAEQLGATDVAALVEGGLGDGAILRPPEVAALLVALAAGWDDARHGMERVRARAHVRLWTDVVRRAPERLVADPAALLALAAWLAGQGALAWCAVDRCLAVEPAHPLGQMVATMLTEAVPPQRWKDEGRAPGPPGE